jgi:hypothetical protein
MDADDNVHNVIFELGATALHHLTSLVVIVMCCVPVMCYIFVREHYYPQIDDYYRSPGEIEGVRVRVRVRAGEEHEHRGQLPRPVRSDVVALKVQAGERRARTSPSHWRSQYRRPLQLAPPRPLSPDPRPWTLDLRP